MIRQLLSRLFRRRALLVRPTASRLPAGRNAANGCIPGVEPEDGIEEAARVGSIEVLRRLPQGVVEAWANVQAARLMARNTVIQSIPWWYPVHPTTMAYFVAQQWWSVEHVAAHATLGRYAMTTASFGGNAIIFNNTEPACTPTQIAQWCLQMLHFDLAPETKASLLGHTLVCIGAEAWLSLVVPLCDGRMEGVELDVIFAVCMVPRPAGVSLEMSPELDQALRSVTPPNTWDSYATEDLPYQLSEEHPNFVLRYMLEARPAWSGAALYSLGAELKRLEGTTVESFALPEDLR